MTRLRGPFAVILTLACLLPAAPANADGLDLKSMILMPGPLTLAHADEEKNCESCHSSFDKSAQNSLCLECHEPIATDQQQQSGFHGLATRARNSSCKSCHTDHQGRDYNIVPLDQDIFDHQDTNFPLSGKHSSTACSNCHQKDTPFRETPGECYSCHQNQDQHRTTLGQACGDCHTPRGWNKPEDFDHTSTDFPLEGHHQELQCSSCHAGEQYSFDDINCIGCHQLRDVHLGRYGQDCRRCHSQENWTNQTFDHAAQTEFPLTGAHRDSSCRACHFGELKETKPATECASCHRSSDIHAGRHGDECETCHNTSRWDEARFDHGAETNWPLTGRHKELACLQCHRGSLDDSLETGCISCHRADDPHKSEHLKDCSACHQSTLWSKTAEFDHELTQFPLEGMHATATCPSCHSSHEFKRAEQACVDCHHLQDAHKSALGQHCSNCHTPNGWSLWIFDHGTTDFDLGGAHAGLSCSSCHQGEDAGDIPNNCAGCHAGDDRHEGSFGSNCGRCHSSDSFGEIQWRK
jgi:Cytochrome c7 and related cytochrome c